MLNKNSGYLIVEVLVLLVIFAALGITLYQFSMKSNAAANNANTRSIAIQIANEVFDKIKANQSGAIAGLYTTYSGGANIGAIADSSCKAVSYNVSHPETVCNYTNMAKDDLMEIQRSVAGLLPQGSFVICKDSLKSQGTPTNPNCNDSGTDLVVKIFWKDRTSKDIGTNSGYSQVILGGAI